MSTAQSVSIASWLAITITAISISSVASLAPSAPSAPFVARIPLLLPRSISARPRGRASCPRPQNALLSSLKETFEPGTTSNETLSDGANANVSTNATAPAATATATATATVSESISPQQQFQEASPPAATATATATATVSESISPQQQFQEVLSSPDLLDPTAILDATIGISNDDEGAASDVPMPTGLANNDADVDSLAAQKDNDSAIAPSGAATSDAVTSFPARASATSKEEDLELTRQAILKHIQQISMESDTQDDDEDENEDEDEDESIESNNLQQLEQTKQESKLTSLSESTPSIAKILRYTIPAIGIWLCSPVLSMIDTAAVGLLSGTAQQAALNPAVSVTDYGALVVAFMYTATTNLIAAAVQEDKDDNATETSRPKTTTTLITGLKLALLVGSIFGVILGTSGKQLLKLLIGNDALDPTVFSAALQYVRIRALGMPAMVIIGTAQSACLGMQDVTSP
eukprot:CAMPEP_0183744294 /NCGR_PEP_ID=MMETSP0737-20130205/65658_1 /TAXON_ID=385413 /ORGANISM="Thalassiosira miniscula, Strain CCMP1093" /LENGTH=464 /DNA_ID=CAMNT_0025979933 /DNA_START=63 /DNA_END=1454 /DNA_ORIENTATION=-